MIFVKDGRMSLVYVSVLDRVRIILGCRSEVLQRVQFSVVHSIDPCSINPPSWGGYVGFHSSSSTSSTSTSSSSSSADFGTLPEWYQVSVVHSIDLIPLFH